MLRHSLRRWPSIKPTTLIILTMSSLFYQLILQVCPCGVWEHAYLTQA